MYNNSTYQKWRKRKTLGKKRPELTYRKTETTVKCILLEPWKNGVYRNALKDIMAEVYPNLILKLYQRIKNLKLQTKCIHIS